MTSTTGPPVLKFPFAVYQLVDSCQARFNRISPHWLLRPSETRLLTMFTLDGFQSETMGDVVQLPHLLTIWSLIALRAAVADGLCRFADNKATHMTTSAVSLQDYI